MENIKKILIKLPKSESMVINAFPLLLQLGERYPKAEINLLLDYDQSWVLNFLPFKVLSYKMPKEKMNLLEIHQYCANFHDIFNIDLFFDFENTLQSSFLGFNFRARHRIGFQTGMNKYLYTKSFANVGNLNFTNKSLLLLENFLNTEIEPFKIAKEIKVYDERSSTDSNVIPLFKTPEKKPFIMVMLDDFASVSTQIHHWKKFFDGFEKQRFVIWSAEDEDVISDLFLSIDLGHNELYMHKGKKIEELSYILSKMEAVVTNNLLCEGLCTYLNHDLFSFHFNGEAMNEYKFFEGKPIICEFLSEDKIILKNQDEDLVKTSMNEVVDYIHQFLKL